MSLVLKRVGKSFGKTQVLKDVSIEVEKGELFSIVGPSGSGKTTLLRIIAGLVKQDEGNVYIEGKLVDEHEPAKRNVGMVFQNYALYPNKSVLENIASPLLVKGVPKSEAFQEAEALAQKLEISNLLDRYPSEISGGQQQRVALARALASTPRLLLLDEPFSNLDARLREELRWELKRIQAERGITMVHVTHDYTEALALADHIVVLNQGKVEQEGEAEWLIENPKNEFVAWFLGYNVVKINGECVWFRPHKARLSQDGELCGLVELVQNAYFGKKVRVKGNGWSVEVLEQGDVPKLGSTVCVKLLEMRHFANWEKL